MSGFRIGLIANAAPKWRNNETVWQVTIPEGGAEYRFRATGVPESVIKWGDGEVTTAATGTNEQYFAHSYATAGVYTITLVGLPSRIVFSNDSATYGKLVTKLINVAHEKITSANNMLSHCSELTDEDAEKLALVRAVSHTYCVSGNTNFAVFPFIFPEGVTGHAVYCASNKSPYGVRDGFFLPDAFTNYTCMFENMSDIRADITHWFDSWTKPKTVTKMLRNCKNLTGTAPADKLWDSGWDFGNTTDCFLNCTGLSNYNEIPASWGGGGA